MYLKNILFKTDIVFESGRADQAQKFKVKSRNRKEKDYRRPIYKEGDRFGRGRQIGYETIEWTEKTFVIFKKGLSVDFNQLTVIVGDNGCGKTSLVKNLKTPKESLLWALNEEQKKQQYIEWVDNSSRQLLFEKYPDYIIVGKEIHKNAFIEDLKTSKINLNARDIVSLFDMNQSSNGENTLDFINGLVDNVQNALIVLDEPETSLSIKSQLKVAAQIQKLAMHNQVIVITHSPYIMQITDTVYDLENKKKVDSVTYIKKQEHGST